METKILSVNVREHGDGKRVYITITDGSGSMTFTANADRISIFCQAKLADDARLYVESLK
jgi:hypothetical protein